jgi:hypothetical protein
MKDEITTAIRDTLSLYLDADWLWSDRFSMGFTKAN